MAFQPRGQGKFVQIRCEMGGRERGTYEWMKSG